MVFLSSKIPNEIKIYLKEIVSTQWNEIQEIDEITDLNQIPSHIFSVFIFWHESSTKEFFDEIIKKFPNAITVLITRDNEAKNNRENDIDSADVNFSFRICTNG